MNMNIKGRGCVGVWEVDEPFCRVAGVEEPFVAAFTLL